MRRLWMLGTLLALLIAVTSCAPVRSGVYTLASTKQGADVMGAKFTLVKKDATATVSIPIILFPLGVPRDHKAMDMILEENNGDVLTNVRVTNKTSMVWLLFFFGSSKITVSADVWRVATQAEIETGDPAQFSTLQEIGEVSFMRGGQAHMTAEGGSL